MTRGFQDFMVVYPVLPIAAHGLHRTTLTFTALLFSWHLIAALLFGLVQQIASIIVVQPVQMSAISHEHRQDFAAIVGVKARISQSASFLYMNIDSLTRKLSW